ncbi:hypothetical protein B0H10DRAFT_2233236 [Mycena sp. CBHHK59/15]|nr:hypothetical protein B0H10DRAFT_2233236 [Mycena sp. CBHHK59/15]
MPTPRTPTPRRLRTIALRESLEQKLYAQTNEFAPSMPSDPAGTSSCRMKKKMCYGQGNKFNNIGRWSELCVNQAHIANSRGCTNVQMLTPQLLDWELDVLRDLWIRYDFIGKKWGKQDIPEHLLTPISGPQPPIPAARRTSKPSLKRQRSPSPPRHLPAPIVAREIIDLTLPSRKKRKVINHLGFIDLTN